jgi:hypothetical protein
MIALAGVLVATTFAGTVPAKAADGWGGSFCIGYREGGVDCSFTSYAQCQASSSGIDSACFARAPTVLAAPDAATAPRPRGRKASKRNAAGT